MCVSATVPRLELKIQICIYEVVYSDAASEQDHVHPVLVNSHRAFGLETQAPHAENGRQGEKTFVFGLFDKHLSLGQFY